MVEQSRNGMNIGGESHTRLLPCQAFTKVCKKNPAGTPLAPTSFSDLHVRHADLVTPPLIHVVHADSSNRGNLIGEIEAGKYGAALPAKTVIDPPHDIGPDDSAKSDSRCDAIVFETDVFE